MTKQPTYESLTRAAAERDVPYDAVDGVIDLAATEADISTLPDRDWEAVFMTVLVRTLRHSDHEVSDWFEEQGVRL